MKDEQVIPININTVIHEFDDYLMIEIPGPFDSRSISVPRGETPGFVLPTMIELRAIAWDHHYKTGSLRAIYTYDDSQEVHMVFDLREMAEDTGTKEATIHRIEEPLSDDELADEYTLVWAPDDSNLDIVEPKYGG